MDAIELKGALERLGLTQRALAAELGCTPEHVNRMIKGKKAVRRSIVLAVERLLRESER